MKGDSSFEWHDCMTRDVREGGARGLVYPLLRRLILS